MTKNISRNKHRKTITSPEALTICTLRHRKIITFPEALTICTLGLIAILIAFNFTVVTVSEIVAVSILYGFAIASGIFFLIKASRENKNADQLKESRRWIEDSAYILIPVSFIGLVLMLLYPAEINGSVAGLAFLISAIATHNYIVLGKKMITEITDQQDAEHQKEQALTAL